MYKKKKTFKNILRSSDWKITLLTYVLAILFIFPIFWVFLMSLKNSVDAFALPPKLIFRPVFENFIKVFQNNFFMKNYKNSFFLATMSTGLSLLIGLPAAYILTRYRFRGRKLLSFWILVTRMAPASAMVVPFFIILFKLNLLDSFLGLIIVYMSFNIGYIIWMMRGFILSVPIECEEAAAVDGLNSYGTFWHITLPMCIPGIVAVGIQAFIFAWNEFLYALILTRNNWKTAPIAVLSYITSEGIMWSELAAASILIILPVLVLAFCIQKYIISGLTMGAIKG